MDIFNRIRSMFSFFIISDEELKEIIEIYINDNTNIEDDINDICDEIYEILRTRIQDENIDDIVNFINQNMESNDYITAVNSLNSFASLIDRIGVSFTTELYNEIINKTEHLEETINTIVNQINVKESDFLKTAIDIINIYCEENYYEQKKFNGNGKEKNPTYTNDALTAYLRAIGDLPMLPNDELLELIREYQETKNVDIRKKIVSANLKLVVSVAKEIFKKNKSLPLIDLIETGNLGLFRAIEDYDSTKSKFSTYATSWIRQKILREIQNNSRTIRIPVPTQDKMREYLKQKKQLEEILTRMPTITELVEYTKLSEETITNYELYYSNTISLSTPLKDKEDGELIDLIADKKAKNPEQHSITNDKTRVKQLLNVLDDTERFIISYRIGLYDGNTHTLTETATALKQKGLKERIVTGERIRQIEKIIKDKFKVKLRELEGFKKTKKITIHGEFTEYNVRLLMQRLAYILKNIDIDILAEIIESLTIEERAKLFICFGNKPYEGTIQENAPFETQVFVVQKISDKIESKYEQIKNNLDGDNIKRIPQNIYIRFCQYDKEEVDKAIDGLKATERIKLNKFYDIYTGEYNLKNMTAEEKMSILSVLTSIENNLPKKIKKKTRKNA